VGPSPGLGSLESARDVVVDMFEAAPPDFAAACGLAVGRIGEAIALPRIGTARPL
jgi:hypothetical protein